MPKVSKREEKRAVKVETTPKAENNVQFCVQFSPQFMPKQYLSFSRFNGQDFIHIREYETTGERMYPTKKGVCFTPTQLMRLLNLFEEINERRRHQSSIAFYKMPYKNHLGAGFYVSINECDGVDLRHYWRPKGASKAVPTKNGIYLPPPEWTALKEKLNELLLLHPELTIAEQCFASKSNGAVRL